MCKSIPTGARDHVGHHVIVGAGLLDYMATGRDGIQFCAWSAVKSTMSTTSSVKHPQMNAVTLTAIAQRSFVSFCFSSPAYK